MALLIDTPVLPPREGRFHLWGSALSLLVHTFVALPLIWLAAASPPETPPRLLTLHVLSVPGDTKGTGGTNDSPPTGPAASTTPATTPIVNETPPPAETSRAKAPQRSPKKTPSRGVEKSARDATPSRTASALTSPKGQPDAMTGGPMKGGGTEEGRGEHEGLGGTGDPVLTNFTKPPYPRRSRQAGEEGRVVVEAHVSVHGTLIQAVVLHSSGHERLDEAARSSLTKARFQPATRHGRPVEGKLRVPFVFSLHDKEGA